MEILDKEAIQAMVDDDDYKSLNVISPMIMFEIAIQLEKLVELQQNKNIRNIIIN